MPAISLPNFTVTDTTETDHDIMVNAEYMALPYRCERCESRTADLKRHDAREHWFFDFPIRGKRVKLCVKHRRFKCSECGAVFFEPLAGIDPKRDMTKRLVDWIGAEALAMPFNVMAHNIGCTDSTIRNIFLEYVEKQAKLLTFKTPRVLGIDEICLGKKRWDKYRCVVTDIEKRTLVELLRDRDKKTVIKFFCTLDRSAIDIVCMDMWPSYRDAARIVFPDAVVVIDRFHIVRMVQNSMEAFRKAIRKPTTGKERAMLKNDRYVLLSRNIDLDIFQQATLSSWFKRWPLMEDVYDAKERFLDIWLAENRDEATFLYDGWKNSIPEHVRSYFHDIFSAFDNWSNEIFNFWDYRFTNAFTEALNNGIRSVYASGNGYSFEVLRAKLLYTKGTHKLFEVKPKYNRKAFDDTSFQRLYVPPAVETVNYGVDISTLLTFIETGRI
jgi:transposase